jgi:hypothetical protein
MVPALTVIAPATLTTDYRLRGDSRTDTKPAIRRGITMSPNAIAALPTASF